MMAPKSVIVTFEAKTMITGLTVSLLALMTIIGGTVNGANSSNDLPDGCKYECYPNTRMITKGQSARTNENCRWILRTDGKRAHICDDVIKCTIVCSNGVTNVVPNLDNQEAASSLQSNLRIEQRYENESDQPQPQPQQQQQQGGTHGIMRQLHGSRLGKAPVPGVSGGRLSGASAGSSLSSSSGKKVAPTLAPQTYQFDESDNPPPLQRFLDISPDN